MQKNSVVILINLLSDYFEQVKSFFYWFLLQFRHLHSHIYNFACCYYNFSTNYKVENSKNTNTPLYLSLKY